MSTSLLSIIDLSAAYEADNLVIAEFNLQVPAGSITAILGPNGAGKTTLLHTILGKMKQRSGVVSILDKPTEQYSRRELGRLMSLVPQSERVPFEYSLRDYVLFGRTPYLNPLEMPGEQDWQLADEVIARVGLNDLADRPVSRLSGGERQLAMLARALAQQPRLLLMDEPASHLDLANKLRLLEIMTALASQGLTVLLTTHEPEIASRVADYLVLIRRGKLMFAGSMADGFTPENLSACYGVPIDLQTVQGRQVILWG